MYDLSLTPEQIEFRDTVRDFAAREVTPVVLHPERLQQMGSPLALELVDKASGMGLRALEVDEELGGADADSLTACIVAEELGAGDAGVAVTLAETWMLAGFLFGAAMTPPQRARFLPAFMADGGYHLAYAARRPDSEHPPEYHRAHDDAVASVSASRPSGGDWVLNGVSGYAVNAPVARLFVVEVQTSGGIETLVVPADTPGVQVREVPSRSGGISHDGAQVVKWCHGTCGELVFQDCRVPSDNVLTASRSASRAAELARRRKMQTAAINLGVGRAAFETAVAYAKLRVQGGRPIIQHPAVGAILARVAVKIETARNMIWHAAWMSDHPDQNAERDNPDLPLEILAALYTAEAMHEAAEGAAECFGAMGVMLDMPLPKYLHDTRVFLHSENADSAALLRIAEAVAGFRRPVESKAAA